MTPKRDTSAELVAGAQQRKRATHLRRKHMDRVADRIPVVIDCDTGIDDALALLYAVASPEIDLLAVTCVARQRGGAAGRREHAGAAGAGGPR